MRDQFDFIRIKNHWVVQVKLYSLQKTHYAPRIQAYQVKYILKKYNKGAT